MTPDYAGGEPATQRLILASSSPRRRQLLAFLTDEFEAVAPQLAEGVPGSPADLVRIAVRKAEAVWPGAGIVIGADTAVFLAGRFLGKPRDLAQAWEFLRALSGRWHEVYTGVCVLGPAGCLTELAATRVKFLPLSEGEIDWYLASEEVLDKAGAYAIQGRAGLFIERIEGDFYNVMGFPLSTVYRLLRRQGWCIRPRKRPRS